MDEKDEGTKDEVAFNLGSSVLEIIGDLLKKANDYSLGGYNRLAFHTMRQITLIIDPKLSEQHRNILRLYENYFTRIVKSNSNENLTTLYLKYQGYIMGLLQAGGYLVPSKIDESSLF